MVIFYSYVSLPEGKSLSKVFVPISSHRRQANAAAPGRLGLHQTLRQGRLRACAAAGGGGRARRLPGKVWKSAVTALGRLGRGQILCVWNMKYITPDPPKMSLYMDVYGWNGNDPLVLEASDFWTNPNKWGWCWQVGLKIMKDNICTW